MDKSPILDSFLLSSFKCLFQSSYILNTLYCVSQRLFFLSNGYLQSVLLQVKRSLIRVKWIFAIRYATCSYPSSYYRSFSVGVYTPTETSKSPPPHLCLYSIEVGDFLDEVKIASFAIP